MQNVYTNTRPLWHPPGARGIYGGAVIAQCLSVAQRTLPADFSVHSMHCYFVLAGDIATPVIYHVERIRDGRSFATRSVQAKQRGNCIFTTILSFVREGSGGRKTIEHATSIPDMPPPAEANRSDAHDVGGIEGPFESYAIETPHGLCRHCL